MTRARLLAVALALALVTSAVAVGGVLLTASDVAADEGTRIADGDRLTLQSGPGQAIRGRTNLQAGTKLSVRVESESGKPFLMTDETVVDQNGTFRTVVDLSDVPPGTEFTVTVHRDGTDLTATEGTVVECTDACEGQSTDDAATETAFTFAGDRLALQSGPGRAVTGRTELPAGTELGVRLESEGEPKFYKSSTVTVDSEGRFRAVFDLWDLPPGTEFRATVDRDDVDLATTKGTVVACSVDCGSPRSSDDGSSSNDRDWRGVDDLSLYETTPGEVARIPLTFGEGQTARLSVGGPHMTYGLDVTVEDGDGDGNVTVLFDTGAVGTGEKPVTVADADDSVSVRDESGPSSGRNVLDEGEYPLVQYQGDRPTGLPSEDRGALLVRDASDGSGDETGVSDFGLRNASFGEAVYRSDSADRDPPDAHSVETRLGETARIELRTDEAKTATVTIGEFDHNYTLSATVRDGDGDERVVLLFDTTAAQSGGETPTLTAADPADGVTVTAERGSLSAAEYDVLAYVGPEVELGADLDGSPKRYRLLDAGGLIVTEAGTTPTLAVTDDPADGSGPPLSAVGALGLASLLAIVGVALLVGVFEVGR
ncbi:BGTF surface domain-containing protein [Halorussus salinisoli]|uniref:BGTF surface domain-containing protein n=1 Tax=Halorussus salinisoli TaxID=2558242 RepID=UPI0010C19EB5|nr:BGTF surface domain-containing protein [Halorussus salinisoli]